MSPADLPRGLPKRQARFLLHLAQTSSLDRHDYQALTGASHSTARRDLAELLAVGLVRRSGVGRATRYSLPVSS